MANGDYRWGRESKLVSAVAVAISMVEEKKQEPIPRIAELIGESPSAILRQWTHVLSTLDLHIRPTSPLLLLAMLHAYLVDASSPPSILPTCILNNLSSHSFSLSSALDNAERIATFFSLTNSFALLPSAPTTCGIFLVAIECEQGNALSLSTAAAFAECLGKRFGVKGSTVLSRRRSMMMIFSEWAALLPWASVPSFSADGRNLWTVNKMSAIVRYVGDVLQFQYELSNRRGIRPDDHSQTFTVEGEESISEPHSRASPATENSPSPVWWTSLKSRERPRGSDAAQRMITMLLQPTSANKLPRLDSTDDPEDVQERLSRIELQVLYGSDQLRRHQPLSRLQALVLQRGGTENISDDELFEPGELEGYQNSKEDALLLGASHPEWDTVETHGDRVESGRGKEKQKGKGKIKRSKADKVPIQVSYSDDEDDEDSEVAMELDGAEADRPCHSRSIRASPGKRRNRTAEAARGDGGDDAEKFLVGKDAYLAFGIFPGWEGDDSDTVRYFCDDMDET